MDVAHVTPDGPINTVKGTITYRCGRALADNCVAVVYVTFNHICEVTNVEKRETSFRPTLATFIPI